MDSDDGFILVEDVVDFLVLEVDGSGFEMDIVEDYLSEIWVIMRKDLVFCVFLICVEDWSFLESDMEDEFEDVLFLFSFVGIREKVIFFLY